MATYEATYQQHSRQRQHLTIEEAEEPYRGPRRVTTTTETGQKEEHLEVSIPRKKLLWLKKFKSNRRRSNRKAHSTDPALRQSGRRKWNALQSPLKGKLIKMHVMLLLPKNWSTFVKRNLGPTACLNSASGRHNLSNLQNTHTHTRTKRLQSRQHSTACTTLFLSLGQF